MNLNKYENQKEIIIENNRNYITYLKQYIDSYR